MIHLTARIRKILEEDVLLQNTLQQIYDRDRQDKTFKMKVGLNSPSFMSGYYYKNWIDLKHVKNYGIDLERTWYRIELN
ncbi:hypothetical protein G9F31_07235 [Acinetobacter sp. 187]|uniref:hypothetical protein n=1 Tax=Acinetobacter lanii TaxID=2715163 RepID=UPI0014088808|nr:hypothetical protein [Acinetobacter lanii]NHC03563.1 hypothetical protein [Acinetobacter lanii]